MSYVTYCSWNVSILSTCVYVIAEEIIPITRTERGCLPAVVTYSAESKVDISLLDLLFRHGKSVGDVRRVLGGCVRQSSQSEGGAMEERARQREV